MKDLEEEAEEDNTDGESPDKLHAMRDRRAAYAQANQESYRSDNYGSSSSDFNQRFGNVHMNETALEYFQNANLAGKTSEQMI